MTTGAIAVNDNTKIDVGMPMEEKLVDGATLARYQYEISSAHGIAVVHNDNSTSTSLKGYNIKNSYEETVNVTVLMFSGITSSGSLRANYISLASGEDESFETNTSGKNIHPLLIFW